MYKFNSWLLEAQYKAAELNLHEVMVNVKHLDVTDNIWRDSNLSAYISQIDIYVGQMASIIAADKERSNPW